MNIKHLFIRLIWGLTAWALIVSCSWFALREIKPEPMTVSKCLMQTHDKDALRECMGPVVESADYDLYQRRWHELLWKNEAF